MNSRIIALGVVFVAFAIFTAEAFADMGLIGFFAAHEANMATRQVFIDLVIALTIVLGFVWGDAKERGLPRLPYVVATLLLGSFGPLAYLIHRELSARSGAADAAPSRPARAV
jgi:hypothetical protein